MWQRISTQLNELGDWIKQYPKHTAVALAVLLIAVHLWTKVSLDWQWAESEGEILVDEPKVYTRERLVNDRFTEEEWLGKQLRNMDQVNFSAPQAKMSSANSHQLKLAIQASKSDNNAIKPDPTLQPDAASLEKAQSDIAPAPIDTFTEMLDYRDKIRNELMRIQLDDRHDIEGNTLYRLNFDTAIIPGASTHAAAGILVTIMPAADDANNAHIKNIFRDWKEEMQELVDKLVIDRVTLFGQSTNNLAATLQPAEQVVFEGFLRNEVCEAVKSLSEELYGSLTGSPIPEISCQETPQEPWYKDLLGTITGASKKNVHYDCSEHENTFFCEVEKLMGSYSMNFMQAKINKNAQIFFENLNKEIKGKDLTVDEVKELSKKIAQICNPAPQNSNTPREIAYHYDQNGVLSLSAVPVVSNIQQKQKEIDSWQRTPCLQMPTATHRIVVIMGLLDRLKAIKQMPIDIIRSLVKPNELPKGIDLYPSVIEELARPYACGKPEDKINPLLHLTPYKYMEQYTGQCGLNQGDHPDEGIQQTPTSNIEQLMVKYLAKKLQEQELNHYFTPVVEGCDMQQCRLVLYKMEDAIEKFKKNLGSVKQTFSYAVTPQMQTQRIALLNKQKNQLNALINASLLGGGNSVDGLIQQLTTLEKELEILERHSIVVGFGDWQYETKRTPNTETRFGWVIQPRLTGNQNLFDSPEFRQVSDHYSLSAVISIPSWWNEINVQVHKCWLKVTELSAADSSLCKNASSSWQSPSFTIKVPGTTDDIHQKLGFEVVKTPYLFPPTSQLQIFEVGREAKVLLEGERLWRSTVVMLDNQKADSIEVLPDMKAVLAKFTCLKPAAGSDEIMENYLYDDSSFPKISEKSLLAISKQQKDNNGASTPTNPKESLSNTKTDPSNNSDGSSSPTHPQAPTADQPSGAATNYQSNPDGNSQNNNASSPHANTETDITVGCMPSPSPQFQQSRMPKGGCIAHVRLWTSEDSTYPLQVVLKPFVQRYVGELPCYVDQDKLRNNDSQANK